jgi:hypothetical protein
VLPSGSPPRPDGDPDDSRSLLYDALDRALTCDLRSEQDLTPADIRLGPADLETLDALITTGTAVTWAEAVSRVLARIRERPALP